MSNENVNTTSGDGPELKETPCSTEYFFVVMSAQKFEEHFSAFGGFVPVAMGQGCPKRFLAVFDNQDEAVEWAGDASKVRLARAL